MANEEEDASELKLGEDFAKEKCLMNAEVVQILQHKLDTMGHLSEDPGGQMSQVFEKSFAYVKRFSRYKNPEAVERVRGTLSRNQLAEYEVCVLGNLCPESVEEAKALVPSIATKGRLDDDTIEQMLMDLSTIKTFE